MVPEINSFHIRHIPTQATVSQNRNASNCEPKPYHQYHCHKSPIISVPCPSHSSSAAAGSSRTSIKAVTHSFATSSCASRFCARVRRVVHQQRRNRGHGAHSVPEPMQSRDENECHSRRCIDLDRHCEWLVRVELLMRAAVVQVLMMLLAQAVDPSKRAVQIAASPIARLVHLGA